LVKKKLSLGYKSIFTTYKFKKKAMEVSKSTSDQEIISGIRGRSGLEHAVRELYRNYFGLLRSYIVGNNGNQQDAEDIFQEVVVSFIDIVQKDKFRGESSLKTFLYSMCKHTWLNELKRRSRAQFREEKFETGRDLVDFDTSQYLSKREERQTLINLVEKLGVNCKKVLLMFYYENLSMKEILSSLHYENEQVLRNKKYKCLKQLEQLINEKPALKQTLKAFLNE